ncbi:MAG: 1-phosphofructokinase [Epulopiscium sp. Nele67-Bin005]|nr:MAG: 1-phosphofructokinase [Epulopiscium sp. Nele67-Bin005]
MIYTVTLNPSIDYLVNLENLDVGTINRVNNEQIFVGGKGINVSLMLNKLDISSTALGIIAGFTGVFVEQQLEEKGIESHFVSVEQGFSRINIKIKSEQETEINGSGPIVLPNHIDKLLWQIKKLTSDDILVISGSIPSSINCNIYKSFIEKATEKGAKVVVDATKTILTDLLEYKPFLIKPNKHELEEIFDVEINSVKDVICYAQKLREQGAVNVLISLGAEGAILINENNEILMSNVAKGEVKNSVGAGDSMVAGFIGEFAKSQNYEKALIQGASCGCATAFSADIATKQLIDEILPQIKVEKL